MPTSAYRSSHFPAIEKKHGQSMSYWFSEMTKISDQKYPEQIAYLKENHGFSQAHANALVLYSKGNLSSRRYSSLSAYLKSVDKVQAKTIRAIFDSITEKYPALEIVIAWNQPMIKYRDKYIFGASCAKNHILIAPWFADVLELFRLKLTMYKVNKKTIQIPNDWQIDTKLLHGIIAASMKQARVKD